MRSPTLPPIRINAADTSASSAIADCTPLAVVSRSFTTAEIETFISEVSTTSTNIAIASRIASFWSPLDSAGTAAVVVASAVTEPSVVPRPGRRIIPGGREAVIRNGGLWRGRRGRLSERPVRKLAAITPVLLAVCALAASGCAGEPTSSGAQFQPRTSGVLTVATAFLPAPGFWQGRGWQSGFEAALAAALARELGLDRVRVVQVPFAALTAGNLGRADLALSQLTPTASRERSLDFSTAYLTAPPGVLAAKRTNADDLSDLRALRWVVSSTSTL